MENHPLSSPRFLKVIIVILAVTLIASLVHSHDLKEINRQLENSNELLSQQLQSLQEEKAQTDASLPDNVELDVIIEHIENAIKNQDWSEAKSLFEKYRDKLQNTEVYARFKALLE